MKMMMRRESKWVEVKDIIYIRIRKHWRYGRTLRFAVTDGEYLAAAAQPC
jgi:hypothetical protein